MSDINETIDQEELEDDFDVIELLDETGTPVRMCLMTVLRHEGNDYVALVAEDALTSDDEETDVTFMQIIEQAEGAEPSEDDEWLRSIEDEDLMDTLFGMFLEWVEAQEEEVDDEA